MSVDVAGPQLAQGQVLEWPLGMVLAEVHHHGHVGERASLDRVLDRRPLRTLVMRGLDADDGVAMPAGHLGGGPCLHVGEVLLERRRRACRDRRC